MEHKKNANTGENTELLQAILRLEKKIDRMATQNTIQDKEYLTTHETCLYLGCTRGMIWKMVNAGKLTRLKLENGRTYYATAELKKLIETPLEDAA